VLVAALARHAEEVGVPAERVGPVRGALFLQFKRDLLPLRWRSRIRSACILLGCDPGVEPAPLRGRDGPAPPAGPPTRAQEVKVTTVAILLVLLVLLAVVNKL
jgi:hypothetical protein